MNKRQLMRMMVNKEFLEYPICPFCGEMTDLRGDFLPCCGKTSDVEEEEIEWWVRLLVMGVVKTPMNARRNGEER